MKSYKRLPLELVIWISALFLLATASPHTDKDALHLSLCPLANMGFSWCPGCGLGRAITLLFHGDLRDSFSMHWFGIPALGMISYRIFVLSKMEWTRYKTKNLKEKERYYV